MTDKEPKGYKAKLADFKPDPRNLNRHTQRGRGMVEASQRQRGFARPGFAAADGTMLGGNLSVMDVAPDIGLGDGDVFVVETDGNIPIIHKRLDIEAGSEEAVLLAAEDNQSALVSIDFDPERLAEDIAAGVDFNGVFTEDEKETITDGFQIERYQDLDKKLDEIGEYQDVNITIVIPQKHTQQVKEWLANGEQITSPGMGKGVLKRCELL